MEEDIYLRIEELSKTKSFEELSVSEKQFVEQHLSKKEYESYAEQYQSFITFYEKEKENVKLREGLKENLLEAFDSKHARTNRFFDELAHFIFKPITYQLSGFGIAALLVFLYFNQEADTDTETLSDEEFNKYTQFSNIEMPASNTTSELEDMVFLEEF